MHENPYLSPAASPTPPPLPTFERSPWNGWWTLLWGFILVIAWQVFATVGIFIAAIQQGVLSNLKDPQELEASLYALATDGDIAGLIAFVSIFLVCPACWFLGRARPGFTGWQYLGNALPSWWQWLAWGAATIALAFFFDLIAPFLGIEGPDDSMVKMAQSTQVPLLLYLGVGIGAPLVEEFIFRGALWRGWRHSRIGLAGALVVTSFFWAILHVQYPIAVIAYIFVFGLLLGFAREKSGSIWVPIWMHALNNGIATYEMLKLSS